MNFSPFTSHFPAMHQFAAAKFSNEQIQPSAMLVTSASDGMIQYLRPEHNSPNFIATSATSTTVQAIPVTLSTTPNVSVSSTRSIHSVPQQQQQGSQQSLSSMANSTTGASKYHHPSSAIFSWADVPMVHTFNDPSKNLAAINVPYPSPAVNSTAAILTVQSSQTSSPSMWPVRLMQSVSTMTTDEPEMQPQDLCKVETSKPKEESEGTLTKESPLKRDGKESGDSEMDSDESSKSETEGPSSTSEAEMQRNSLQIPSISAPHNGTLECHQIQLQQQGSAMADYLARLPASTLPLSLQHFLKYQTEIVAGANISIKRDGENVTSVLLGGAAISSFSNPNSTLGISKEKKKKKTTKKPPRPKPGEIRLSTALDGSTLFCCPECHMAYPDRELLEQHLAGHKLERRFVCNVCGAGLKRKEHLDQHKRGHSDERPFVCTVCLKGFKRNEHLTRHYVIHSGCKSHTCSECGKKFSRKDHLHKHAQTHIAKRVKAELSQAGQENGSVTGSIFQSGLCPVPQPGIHHAMVHPLHLHHAMS